jgi:hypothetical protein
MTSQAASPAKARMAPRPDQARGAGDEDLFLHGKDGRPA